MTFMREQAALLLALLPILPTRPVTVSDESSEGEKADATEFGVPMGRQGVLELLESGVISTEEALDLLDGIDQSGVVGGSTSERSVAAEDQRANRPSRPSRSDRPERPARPVRPARPPRGRGPEGDEKENERDRRFQEQVGLDATPVSRLGGKRTFRIQVHDAGGSRVNLALPIGFLDTGLKVAERFSPGLLDGSVGNSIRRAIGSGQSGTIIEVDDAGGSHVRIAIE